MNTKVIKQKIKSVGSIKKITKTMEMVSAAKMKKAIDATLLARSFHMEAKSILNDIARDPLVAHPLLRDNSAKEDLLIIVSSNKGLCGSYNVNVYRKLIASYSKEQREHLSVVAIGKFSEKIARRLGLTVRASFNKQIFAEDDARVLTQMVVEWFLKKEIGKVRVLYTHFTSAAAFTPTLFTLLPFEAHEGESVRKDTLYAYEPSEGAVLTTLIPMMIQSIIYGAVLEGYASEHSARMFAMKNATDNAGELQSELKLYYNRARQSAVTQEIAEIVGGAMALNA